MRHNRGLEASPRCAVYWEWKEGGYQLGAPRRQVALSDLQPGNLVLDVKTPTAPCYHDADRIADACEAPAVSDPGLTDPTLTGASV